MNKPSREDISRLQDSLPTLRKVAGWSAEDLAGILDVTRQTIVNLESGQTKMTTVQYLAIRLIFEAEAKAANNETLANILALLVESDKLDTAQRKKIKDSVDSAVTKVGRRSGATAAREAAIMALVPILASSAFATMIIPGALATVGHSLPILKDLIKGKNNR